MIGMFFCQRCTASYLEIYSSGWVPRNNKIYFLFPSLRTIPGGYLLSSWIYQAHLTLYFMITASPSLALHTRIDFPMSHPKLEVCIYRHAPAIVNTHVATPAQLHSPNTLRSGWKCVLLIWDGHCKINMYAMAIN